MKNRKLRRFNELMTPEETQKLGLFPFLANINDDDYFFDVKDVDRFYDEDEVKVHIHNVRFDGDSLIFKSTITLHDQEFDMYILVDFDQNVEFGSEKGKDYIESFEKALEPEFDYFVDMFEDIYNDIIPRDFWEVKSKVN
jgi:hypothetical protein